MISPSFSRLKLPVTLALSGILLAGCVADTASFMVNDDRNHAIVITRNQDFFWDKTATIAVTLARKSGGNDECAGGGVIKKVPLDADMTLYLAPDEYAERIFLLDVDGDVYAVSTVSCQLQPFEDRPGNLGERIGVFSPESGNLEFVPAQKGKGAKEDE